FTMQIKTIVVLSLLASSVFADGNFVCRSFKIDDDCVNRYICVNAYGNCKVNSNNDAECNCYIKAHHGPFFRETLRSWWQ
ncbi:hypothetical protein BGW42_004430, partial [Actinomortierella wolfii]